MTELHGGEPLAFDGIHFTAVAAPGHTPGSLMYLHGPLLFTGDSLMRKGDGLTTVGWLFSEDPARNRAALPALLELPFETIADGHAGLARQADVRLKRLLASP
jgi:glyoxylase-like metal-dependent hydrolase (beta-lactamase superfamily II)